jgi:homoserine kinase
MTIPGQCGHPFRRNVATPEGIFEAALKAGSPGVALSSAGSGIFAFAYPHNEKAIGEAMKTALAQFGMDGYILFLPFNINGVKIVSVS